MTSQMFLDFTPPAPQGLVHLGPGAADAGEGCDCCAERLRCGVCGARYLGRAYAYYYMENQRDADGYTVAKSSTYELLPGPCCLPDDAATFDAIEAADWPMDVLGNRLVRKGEFVYGAMGVLLSRIWLPASGVWPTGRSPWQEAWDLRGAVRTNQRRRKPCRDT